MSCGQNALWRGICESPPRAEDGPQRAQGLPAAKPPHRPYAAVGLSWEAPSGPVPVATRKTFFFLE
jgi:hypothetical protein